MISDLKLENEKIKGNQMKPPHTSDVMTYEDIVQFKRNLGADSNDKRINKTFIHSH